MNDESLSLVDRMLSSAEKHMEVPYFMILWTHIWESQIESPQHPAQGTQEHNIDAKRRHTKCTQSAFIITYI